MARTFRLLFLAVVAVAVAGAQAAQGGKKPPASPAESVGLTLEGKTVTIKYSPPSVRGRQIFGPGGLLSHDPTYPVWRAGANAATSLHTDAELELGSLTVPKGDYTLFVLVSDPDHWQLIVNKQTGQWGLIYTPAMDLGRTPMAMSVPATPVEQLKYTLGARQLTLAWDGHVGAVAMQMHP